MKTLILIIFCTTVILTSCNSQKSEKTNKDSMEAITKSGENGDFKEAKNCDEFIDQYEKWMDDYVKMLENYMKNPMDAKLMEEYMKLAQESMNWMNQWNSKLAVCASKEKYEKRFNEITERAEKKMEELGIE